MTKPESSLVVSKYHLRKIRRGISVVWEAGKFHCLRGFGAAVLEYAGMEYLRKTSEECNGGFCSGWALEYLFLCYRHETEPTAVLAIG